MPPPNATESELTARTRSTTDSEVQRVAAGSIAGAGLEVFHHALRLFATPVILATVGLEAFGFWALLFQALGLIGLHRIGLPAAAVTIVAKVRSGDPGRIHALLPTMATATLVLGGVLVGLLFASSDMLVGLLGASDDLHDDAVLLLQLTALATLLALTFGGYQSVLEGLQLHPRVRLVEGIASALEVGLLVYLLHRGVGLPALGVAYALRVIAPLPIYAWLVRREIPGCCGLPGRVDASILRELAGFGLALQGCGILHICAMSLDRIFVSHLVSLPAAGAFELARKLIGLVAKLPLQLCGPLVPACARSGSDGDRLMQGALRALLALAAPGVAVLVCAPELILNFWIGSAPTESVVALRVLAVSSYFHIATGPVTARLRSEARGGDETRYMFVWVGCALVLLPLLGFRWGYTGVVFASALAQGSGAIYLMARASRWYGVRPAELARTALVPLACVAPGGAILFETAGLSSAGLGRIDLLIEALPLLAGFLGTSLTLLWLLALRESDRRQAKSIAQWLKGAITNSLSLGQSGAARVKQ